jgi:hypothetical protein
VKTWKSYFSQATIVGVDIDPECQKYVTDRVVIETGSQVDFEFLERVVAKYPPTIVIDDGSHRAHHIRATFEYLFPHLLPGGVYAIEDIFLHLGPRAPSLREADSVLPHDYFALIAKDLAGWRMHERVNSGIDFALLDTIDRIESIPRAAVIYKREKPSPEDFEALEKFAEVTDDANTWFRLSRRCISRNGPLDFSERAVRRAIELNSDDWRFHSTLSSILAKRGMSEEAAQANRRADELKDVPKKKPHKK